MGKNDFSVARPPPLSEPYLYAYSSRDSPVLEANDIGLNLNYDVSHLWVSALALLYYPAPYPLLLPKCLKPQEHPTRWGVALFVRT